MSDTAYCYPPDYIVLRNKLGLTDALQLDRFERRIVAQRIAEGVPGGDFVLRHLRAIHRKRCPQATSLRAGIGG